jgi:hypothetical protein
MPPDNPAPVAVGGDVQFPQDGPAGGPSISRITASTFDLATPGTYEVTFAVSVSEAGQLELSLNGSALAYTVVGRATGTSQIVGEALVTVSAPDAVLAVENPAGNPAALTVTPLAGGGTPDSASLIIQQLG